MSMDSVTDSASALTISGGTDPEVEEAEPTDEEFPAELQQLLERLQEKVESVSEALLYNVQIEVTATKDSKNGRISYWSRHAEDDSSKFSGSLEMQWGTRAKHRLLQAIGSCRTLRGIFVTDLSGKELETVLALMDSYPVLEWIFVSNLELTGAAGGVDGAVVPLLLLKSRNPWSNTRDRDTLNCNRATTFDGLALDHTKVTVMVDATAANPEFLKCLMASNRKEQEIEVHL